MNIETASNGARRRFPTAAPSGLVAAFLLSFLATAGFFYVNIMPALVDALVRGLHFSEGQAGLVASSNVYGASLGALVAVFLVKHIAWRRAAVAALILLIAIDLASAAIDTPDWLIAIRFVDGVVGGLLVGIAFAVIARTGVPDRVFGVLLVVQFSLGGTGVMILPRLVPAYGTPVVFFALILFSAVTLLMVPFLADYPLLRATEPQERLPPRGKIAWGPLFLSLGAIFLFQSGNMALAAYMIGLGRAYGLGIEFISTVIGVASWIGAVGSLLVVLFGTRLGRFWPLFVAFVLTLVGNSAFHLSASAPIYAAANIGTAITWAFIIPYLLGLSASFDKAGQMAAMAGFASHMGLATGPLIGGFLLGADDYGLLINASVAALAVSAVAALLPAYTLDRRRRAETNTLVRNPI
jgi:DHA1 family inner membrane transport protein